MGWYCEVNYSCAGDVSLALCRWRCVAGAAESLGRCADAAELLVNLVSAAESLGSCAETASNSKVVGSCLVS